AVPPIGRRLRAEPAADRPDECARRFDRGGSIGSRRVGARAQPPAELPLSPADLRRDQAARRSGRLHAHGRARRRHSGTRAPQSQTPGEERQRPRVDPPDRRAFEVSFATATSPRPQKRVPRTRSRFAVSDRLAAVVYGVGNRKAAAERADVGHLAVLPEERVPLAQGSVARAHDLPAIVDAVAAAESATERPQVDRRALLPHDGMMLLERCIAAASYLSPIVETVRVTEHASEHVERDHRASSPEKRTETIGRIPTDPDHVVAAVYVDGVTKAPPDRDTI